jgi:hypothetical protein
MGRRESENHELIHWPIEGRTLAITVKKRSRQKHIRLRISGRGEVVVSAPKSSTKTEIKRALSGKSGWISDHLKRIREGLENVDPLKNLYYCGELYPVVLHPSTGSRVSVRLSTLQNRLNVHVPETGITSSSPAASVLSEEERATVEASIAGWLKRKAGEIIRERAAEVSEEISLPFKKLYIRNQRTRWGSSSSLGNISINWRAAMAPEEVQHYLIIHELAHQRHLNHSQAFWQLVAEHCPDYRRREHWLKEHRALISLFR